MRRVNLRWLAGLMVAAMLCGGVIHLIHWYQMPRIATAFMREARRAQEENRPSDALRHLRRYVSLLPMDIEGLAVYGQQLADVGRVEPAYLTLEKVLRLQPGRADTQRTLVTLAMQLGRHQEAQVNIDNLLSRSPKDPELWELNAICQASRSEYEQARKTLMSTIELAPDRLESYGLLASLLSMKLKRPAEAEEWLEQMVSNNLQNFKAYLNRGQWRLDSLRNSGALSANVGIPVGTRQTEQLKLLASDAERARELSPESPDVLAFSARVALAERRFDAARIFIEQGLELHPSDPRFYLTLADVEMASSGPTAAIEALSRGVRTIPQNVDLRWSLANALLDQGNEPESSAVVERMRSAGQPPEQVEFCEARLLLLRGQWLEAIRRLESVRHRLLDWPNVVKQVDFLLGRAYGETDALDLQITSLRRAVEVDPQWVPARMALAESLLAANLVRQASEEYRKLYALPTAPPSAGIELAKSLFRLIARQAKEAQDWSEFDKILNQIEQRFPGSPQVAILNAEKLVNQGQNDQASQLITAAKDKNEEEIDLWIVQITLDQIARNWDAVAQFIVSAKEKFGDTLVLRVVEGRYLIQRYGNEASIPLKKISEPVSTWSNRDRFLFLKNFASLFLVVGDYDEAEQLGLQGAALQPGDLSIRLILCDVALRAKRPRSMEHVLKEVRDITGEGPLWHYGEAVRLSLLAPPGENQQSLSGAQIHLGKARAQRPGWVRIPLLAAELETQQGDPIAATEHLQEAIRLGERNPAILSRAVSLLFSQKRFLEADQVVRRLGERQNLFTTDMLRSASEIAIRLNDTSRAIDLAEQLVRESDDAANKIWLAQVLGTLGRYDEAERRLREVLEAESTAPEPWIVLVQVLARANQRDKAEQVIVEAERAITADQSPLAIAQCYELLDKLDLAWSRYQAALEQSPESLLVLHRVIDFQLKTGRSAEAEPLLKGILKKADAIGERERRWANRSLALALAMHVSPDKLAEALNLIEGNFQNGPISPADERAKAQILARHASLTQRRLAIPILEKLLAHESDTAIEDRYLLARLFLATGDRARARSEYRKLLVARNDDVRFLSAFIQLALQSGETSEAELWLPRLQDAAPDRLLTADLRSQLLFAKKRYSELVTFLKDVPVKTRLLKDDEEESLSARLWAAKQLQGFGGKLRESDQAAEAEQFATEAESMYQQYVEDRPKDVLALAEFYARENRIDRALDLLKTQVEKSPPQHIIAVCVAVMRDPHATSSQLQDLQELLRAAVRARGDVISLKLVSADLMSWRGDQVGAIRLYQEVLERQPKNISALNNMAAVLAMTNGDSNEAFRLIQQAIDLAGQNGGLLDTRGIVFMSAGVPVKALADFQESLRQGETPDRYYHVALACAQLKQTEAAKRALKRARELGLAEHMLHPLERSALKELRQLLEKSA